jgi:hypothetical protein
MDILIFTLCGFTAAVLIMSVGVMFKRKPIAGTCGGIANLMGDCDICEKKSECIDKMKDLSKKCSNKDDCH